MATLIPKIVFVPFEWNGTRWIKRDNLPRFKETYEAMQFIRDHPEINFREGSPVLLSWVECNEPALIKEYLRGVGVSEP